MSAANREAIRQMGRLEYQRARRHGQLNQFWGRLTGHPSHLRSLSAGAPSTAANGRFDGVQTVPIRCIQGSESRSRAFDPSFNPLSDETLGRWVSVFSAWKTGQELPPVELIRVGDAYYVRDGHHRVSVARAMGQEYIEAAVTAWE